MRSGIKGVVVGVAIGATAAILIMAVIPLAGQGQAYRAPRAQDGHADLNGIWQALNEANYDLQMHTAKHALAMRPGIN